MKAANAKKTPSYKAQDIEVLEGLEPVRRRPGMYIGGTELAGLHHLVNEILDNAVDEAMNGHADSIDVILHSDRSSITISDNGRGIPIDKHPKFNRPALEIILTTLHAGAKFSDRNYASAGGLHGVGASVVNALSEDFVATVSRNGFEWEQSFSRGAPTSKLKKGKRNKKTGTTIFFRPDPEIFKSIEFSEERLKQTIEEKAFLNKGLKLTLLTETTNEKQTFHYPDGLKSFLETLLKESKLQPIHKDLFSLQGEEEIRIEASFCWTEATSERILSFVNGIPTRDGGTHVDGFRTGIARAIRNYISVHNLTPRGVKLTGEDIREGMVAILSVNIPGSVAQLQFQGQTKDRLNNPEASSAVESLCRSFENFLNTNPNLASEIVERVLAASRARAAARAASASVSRKIGTNRRLNLPGKLADCSSTKPEKCELFIVEGDSAGGSAKQGRDRKTQAVLPLRGKVINAISSPQAKVKENKELADLVSALGCGFGDNVNPAKLRYGKVIILTDADADGMHIAALLMAFFFKFMRPLIESGNLYLGLPPLYRLRYGSGSTEELFWVFSDEEKEKVLAKKGSRAKLHITRFKGLGEMNPKTLWETTLDPKTRKLLRIQVDDESESQATFEAILGKDAQSRYQMIQENAHRLELDV